MSDGLTTLRLDVARALGWELQRERRINAAMLGNHGAAVETWAHPDGRYGYSRCYGDGIRFWDSAINQLPDYPRDLGACAEVLDAIRERARTDKWRLTIELYADCYWYCLDSEHSHITLSTGEAPTLPEALCRAFMQAVEAGRE